MSASRRVVLDGGAARRALFPSFRREETGHGPSRFAPPDGRSAGAGSAGSMAEEEALRVRVRTEAFEAGLEEGRAAAYAEWTGRLEALARSLEGAGRGLLACRVELAAEVDRQLPRVLFLLARKVLQRELALSDTAARTVIRGLGERLAGCDRPSAVRLNPQMAQAFEAWRRSQADERLSSLSVRIEPDPTVGLGEWVLETRDGFLDGRVESQLEEAWRLLTELGR